MPDKIAHILSEKYDQPGNSIFRNFMPLIRMVALLHDCSHGPFSHTSEEIYEKFPDIIKVLHEKEYSGVSASELLAYFLITSGAFKKWFEAMQNMYDAVPFSPQDIADFISGKSKKSFKGYLNDITSGLFDADKLDYIYRDGHYSGLSFSVDIDRLLYAMEVGEIEKSKKLVVSFAGVSALEQIVFSRMQLTSNVYHHHKVRASDCIFKAIIEVCKETGEKIKGRDLKSASDFLWLIDQDILALTESSRNPLLKSLVLRLLNRNLLKRALVISMHTLEAIEEEGSYSLSLFNKMRDMRNSPDGEKEIRDLSKQIIKKAGVSCSEAEVWVDIPKEPKLTDLAVSSIQVGSQSNPEYKHLCEFLPIDQWGAQYLLNKWRAHVFCPAEHVLQISKASKEVLSERFNMKFNKYAQSLCHIGDD